MEDEDERLLVMGGVVAGEAGLKRLPEQCYYLGSCGP